MTKRRRTSESKRLPSEEAATNLKPHYDFDYSKAKPNRFARMQHDQKRVSRQSHKVTIHKSDGTTVVQRITPTEDVIFLDSDVRKYFPDSESVNNALRGLIALVPRKRRAKPRSA